MECSCWEAGYWLMNKTFKEGVPSYSCTLNG
jgi:hypothetical protein